MRDEKLKIRALSTSIGSQARVGARQLASVSGGQFRAQTERNSHRSPPDLVKNRQARFQKEFHKQVMQAASLSMFERKQQARDELKSVLVEERSRAKQIRFNDKLRQMKGVMKAKLSEIATVKAEKSRVLFKKIEVSKRLEKENKENLKKIREAQRLVNYSLDIENMIKSNIEIAANLEAHYTERATAREDFQEATDKIVEGFSQVIHPDDSSLKDNSSNSIAAKKSVSSTRAGPELSYDINRVRRSQLLQPGLEDGEVCTPRHRESDLPNEQSDRIGSINELGSAGFGGPAMADSRPQIRSLQKGFLPRIGKNTRPLIRKAN